MRDAEKATVRKARQLRGSMTRAEVILWQKLRRRQMAGYRFRRQVPIGPFIADFACVDAKLIVEVDGPTHSDSSDIGRDARRTRFLEQQGWHVHRVWNTEVYDNLTGVLDLIRMKLERQV